MTIALIGMMGTMKSSAAKELSALTGLPCYDADAVFEREEGSSIADIFKLRGEEYFRERETDVLTRLTGMDGIIISCGGGAPLKEENRALLKKCRVILLTATADEICRRLKGDTTRPVLVGEITCARINELMDARRTAYEAAADIIIDTCGKTPKEIAVEIIAKSG